MNEPLGDVVFERLRTLIISHQLRPGMKLVDRALARDLGVSRTPVREALSRLAEVGVVENRDRGYYVADANSRQVTDLYQLREILELGAIQLAAKNAQPADIQELRRILRLLQMLQSDAARKGEGIRVGLEIHQVFARASGNVALHQAIERLLDQMLTFIWIEVLNENQEAAAKSHEEHTLLVDLVQAGRGDEATEVIRTHLRSAKEHVIKVMRARESLFSEAPATVPLEKVRRGGSTRSVK